MSLISHDDLLGALTAPQREAVSHVDGPLLILAGPGSGKTRVITHRIAHLIQQGVHPKHILALTFTNKAAEEMRNRVQQLAPRQAVWMGTFHRFCSRLLREHAELVGLSPNYSILDQHDAQRALAQCLDDAEIDLTHVTLDSLAATIGWAKSNVFTPDEYVPRPGHAVGTVAKQAYALYRRHLLAANAVDFDDLLLHVAVLLRENPELRRELDERYRYILVDEYQDTNLAQYVIVRALSHDYPNLAVTGDPDQSIYGWRGANLRNILEFERDYPHVTVVRLEQNYRSTPNILRVADHLIAYNVQRKRKSLFTENPAGAPVRLIAYPSGRDEAEHIAQRIAEDVRLGRRRPRDFAVFYRVNSLSRQFEQSFRMAGLPFQIVNGLEFFQRQEIKDVLGYLHLLHNPRNDVAFQRVINTPARGIGKTTLARLGEAAQANRRSLLDTAREHAATGQPNKRAAEALGRFIALYDQLDAVHRRTKSLEELLGHIFDATKYRELLAQSESAEDRDRAANLDELLSAAREFDWRQTEPGGLEAFLEQTSLVADTDAFDSEPDVVSLMTLHAAKGLEFPVVFVVGLENGLLPHQRTLNSAAEIEEERRLLFVGLTRAREQLQVSYAMQRITRGALWPTVPSEFLLQLPRAEMEVIEVPRTAGVRPAPRGDYVVDDEHLQSQPEEAVYRDEPAPTRRTPMPAEPSRVMTAAEMLGDGASGAGVAAVAGPPKPRCSPESFHQGMIVTHPERGHGVVVSLSGDGDRRTATVRFLNDATERRFVLSHSPLVPLKS